MKIRRKDLLKKKEDPGKLHNGRCGICGRKDLIQFGKCYNCTFGVSYYSGRRY